MNPYQEGGAGVGPNGAYHQNSRGPIQGGASADGAGGPSTGPVAVGFATNGPPAAVGPYAPSASPAVAGVSVTPAAGAVAADVLVQYGADVSEFAKKLAKVDPYIATDVVKELMQKKFPGLTNSALLAGATFQNLMMYYKVHFQVDTVPADVTVVLSSMAEALAAIDLANRTYLREQQRAAQEAQQRAAQERAHMARMQANAGRGAGRGRGRGVSGPPLSYDMYGGHEGGMAGQKRPRYPGKTEYEPQYTRKPSTAGMHAPFGVSSPGIGELLNSIPLEGNFTLNKAGQRVVRCICNGKEGFYRIDKHTVDCLCDVCEEIKAIMQVEELDMSPREFEYHAGMGHCKRWRSTIFSYEEGSKGHRGRTIGNFIDVHQGLEFPTGAKVRGRHDAMVRKYAQPAGRGWGARKEDQNWGNAVQDALKLEARARGEMAKEGTRRSARRAEKLARQYGEVGGVQYNYDDAVLCPVPKRKPGRPRNPELSAEKKLAVDEAVRLGATPIVTSHEVLNKSGAMALKIKVLFGRAKYSGVIDLIGARRTMDQTLLDQANYTSVSAGGLDVSGSGSPRSGTELTELTELSGSPIPEDIAENMMFMKGGAGGQNHAESAPEDVMALAESVMPQVQAVLDRAGENAHGMDPHGVHGAQEDKEGGIGGMGGGGPVVDEGNRAGETKVEEAREEAKPPAAEGAPGSHMHELKAPTYHHFEDFAPAPAPLPPPVPFPMPNVKIPTIVPEQGPTGPYPVSTAPPRKKPWGKTPEEKEAEFQRMYAAGPQPDDVCGFCGTHGQSPVHPSSQGFLGRADQGLGQLILIKVNKGSTAWVHDQCARWTPEAHDPTGEGYLKGIGSACLRGRRIRCRKCNMKGATMGCFSKNCKHSWHLPCARMECIINKDPFFVCCQQHRHEFGL